MSGMGRSIELMQLVLGGRKCGSGIGNSTGCPTGYAHCGGTGGTQSSAGCDPTNTYGTNLGCGSFGKGGNYAKTSYAGGGGGGYYGGGAANHVSGGGGGSGYFNTDKLIYGTYSMYCATGISQNNQNTSCGTGTSVVSGSNVSETAQANYAKSGNGYARITLISVD